MTINYLLNLRSSNNQGRSPKLNDESCYMILFPVETDFSKVINIIAMNKVVNLEKLDF